MCRRSQPLITLLWITLMLSGCPSRSDHTHTDMATPTARRTLTQARKGTPALKLRHTDRRRQPTRPPPVELCRCSNQRPIHW